MPVSVDPEGDSTDAEDLTDSKLYDVTYQYKQTNGNWAPVKNIDGVGLDNNVASEFKVTITGKAGTAYAGATKTFDFKLVEAESNLADATLYQVGEPDDFSDTTFEYTGAALAYGADKGNIGLLYKGEPVKIRYRSQILRQQGRYFRTQCRHLHRGRHDRWQGRHAEREADHLQDRPVQGRVHLCE